MIEKIKNRIRYYKEKNMTTVVMLGLLLLNAAIVLIGCLILKLLPENHGLSLSDSLWESLKLLLDPGGFLGTKLSAVTTLVTSVIVLCGTITFTGGVIGYVTNIITTMIESSKNGIRDINITDFTLILNWNPRAMAIILDFVHDAKRDNRDEYIVILCERDKAEIEALIKKEIKAYKNSHSTCNKHDPRVLVRNGNPRYSTDLESINYTEAKSIYIMQIEGDETPDFEVIQTCMSIAAANTFLDGVVNDFMTMKESPENIENMFEYVSDTSVVVETSNAKVEKMLSELVIPPITFGKSASSFSISTISNEFTLGKLFAAIAMQPNISYVLQEILSQAGSEFYEYDIEPDTPAFQDELRSLKYAIPVFDRKGGDSILSRVYLSGEASSKEAYETLAESEVRISSMGQKFSPQLPSGQKKIVLFGYNSKLPYILNGILAANKTYHELNYKVLISVSESQRELAEDICARSEYKELLLGRPVFITDGYHVEPLLEQIDASVHSMVVLSRDDYTADETDKEVFEVWMGIHHEMQRNPTLKDCLQDKLIFEVALPSNASLLRQGNGSQIIVSSEYSSLFMVQMAAGSTLKDLLLDMISSSGDSDFARHDYIEHDLCDLQLISVRDFFCTDKKLEFLSKQDVVSNIYEGTDGEYIPLGLIIEKTCYLFTNGGKEAKQIVGNGNIPSLADGYLINSDGGAMHIGDSEYDYSKGLCLLPDYQMVLVHNTAHSK